ncbi:Deoxynucleotidyltransferase terminal-interacting protein 2 [Galemys pyrenaicus]|uniref:Deoxynucleotidyltransferase terminal-interacting protein 2 n=1 Tax=Galemys pyrenaicus TaxID=202257 RepID=A0A8J5ZWN4_GALPY|nr:Deoxynucleotidyltransferase terminal-interacting protein 2 [Galemys pyrenaicus]
MVVRVVSVIPLLFSVSSCWKRNLNSLMCIKDVVRDRRHRLCSRRDCHSYFALVHLSLNDSVFSLAFQNSAAKKGQLHLKGGKEPRCDDPGTAESQTQTTRKQSLIPATPKTKKRKSRTTDSLPGKTKPPDNGETSEAESECATVSEPPDTMLRITRRRQIIVACTPVSSVRKRVRNTSISESYSEEVVSEAESHVSGISRVVTPTVLTTRTRRNKAKILTEASHKSHTESISDAESSCSDMSSFSGIGVRRTTRSMQKKLQAQTEQIHMRKEKQTSDAPLKEIKQNSTSLDEEAKGIIDEGKEINEKNSQSDLSEHQDTGIQQSVSQRHSTPQNNKTISGHSNLNCETVIKSLAQTFVVAEVDKWDDERKNTINTSDLTGSDHNSDEEEHTIIGVSESMNEEKEVDFESDARFSKTELNTSQNKYGSVLLVLSSDESEQSENSENEEDTVCFVENCGREESLNGLKNMSGDNALFVIDRTPGLGADKNFYLNEEDKASEIATEEEKQEEEDETSEEELLDHDKNKDSEFSDEDDLINSTKSKLLKLTSSSIDPGVSIKQLGGLYINFNADKLQSNKKTLTQIKEKRKNELLQKAIITPDFEKKDCIPPYRESKYQLQKKRRKERQKTAGDGWFGMKAPELTDELKNDLKALKMRASMDPKRFYKKNDRDGFPKYFQIGTIVDNPADFYHSRIPKKQRKRTIVEELLADSEFRR